VLRLATSTTRFTTFVTSEMAEHYSRAKINALEVSRPFVKRQHQWLLEFNCLGHWVALSQPDKSALHAKQSKRGARRTESIFVTQETERERERERVEGVDYGSVDPYAQVGAPLGES
jgi:hypothetical protein